MAVRRESNPEMVAAYLVLLSSFLLAFVIALLLVWWAS